MKGCHTTHFNHATLVVVGVREAACASDRLARIALGLLLFFPFVYYPVTVLIWLSSPELAALYKDAIAALAALLTFAAIAFLLLSHRCALMRHWALRKALIAPEAWFILFFGWLLVVSAFQQEPTTIQNLIVYTVFIAAVLLGSLARKSLTTLTPIFVWVFALAIVAVGLWEAFENPLRSNVGWQLGGPRLYASYGVIAVVGLFSMPMVAGIRIGLGIAIFFGGVVTGSRSSMTTVLIVLIVGLIVSAQRFRLWILWAIPSAVVLFVVALQTPWIRAQMAVGGITTPGMPFNDSGRGFVWIANWNSWLEHPLLGQGAGSSQTVSRESDFPLDHPHSLYLRIFLYSGLI